MTRLAALVAVVLSLAAVALSAFALASRPGTAPAQTYRECAVHARLADPSLTAAQVTFICETVTGQTP